MPKTTEETVSFRGHKSLFWYIILTLIGVAAVATVVVAVRERSPLTIAVACAIVVAFLHALTIQIRNNVVLYEDYLVIEFGLMSRIIDYDAIRSMRRVQNIASSTATSRDRYALKLDDGDVAYVSPREMDAFGDALRERLDIRE